MWDTGGADDDLLSQLLRGLLAELIDSKVQAVPAGISDAERSVRLHKIARERKQLRASRADALAVLAEAA